MKLLVPLGTRYLHSFKFNYKIHYLKYQRKNIFMRKIILTSAPIVLLLMFTGCASNVQPALQSKQNTSKQFITYKNASNIYLYRSSSFVGGGLNFLAMSDGKYVGRTGGGTYLNWKVKPGKHIIQSNGLESTASITINAQAGKNYYIHEAAGLGFLAGRPILKLSSEAKAKKSIKGLKLGKSSI